MPLSSTLQNEARKLVDRAGHGDQNAMAMIEQIGKNARGGQALSQESYRVILDYMKKRPGQATMGAETAHALGALKDPNVRPDVLLQILSSLPQSGHEGSIEAACVILCFGPPWTPPRIGALQSMIPPPAHPTFQFGLGNAGDKQALESVKDGDMGVLCAGHCLGMARRLQAVRGGAPLGFLSPDMGWELE